MRNKWKTFKILGETSISKNRTLKITLDSNGKVTVLNIREWYGNIPTYKGIAINIENEELLKLIYDGISLILDNKIIPVKQSKLELMSELRVKSKPKLDPKENLIRNAVPQNTCRTCLLERQQECIGRKNICEYYNPCPSYKISKEWPKEMGYMKRFV